MKVESILQKTVQDRLTQILFLTLLFMSLTAFMFAVGGVFLTNQLAWHTGQSVIEDQPAWGQVMNGNWRDGQILVNTVMVTENSFIFLTPISQPRGQWWVAKIIPAQAFIVESTAPDEDMSFNWLIK
jgi:hypothetical protein